jgi:hypothetical protein
LELEMRRLILFVSSLLLLAALFFLWQFRFERVPGYPTLSLGDIRHGPHLPPGAEWTGTEARPVLRLSVGKGGLPIVLKSELPNISAVDYLRVIYQISSQDLQTGPQRWEDGRGIIEWKSQTAGHELEHDPIFSLCGTYSSELTEQVMRPEKSPAAPALRFENLGASGAFEVSHLEITVVRERWLWKLGRWFLMLGCFTWAVVWCGFGRKVGLVRASAASLVWLVMLLYFVVPGPWKSLRPLATPFLIGEEIRTSHQGVESPSVSNPTDAPQPSVPSAGKIPDKGDFTLWIKVHAAKARPLLHILLLFGPTLVIAGLVGKSPAASLGVILSIAVEAAQVCYGYGFDWVDVSDLACDAIGIFLALALAGHPWLRERFRCNSENPCRSVPVE